MINVKKSSQMSHSIISNQRVDLADTYPQVKALLLLASLNGYDEVKKLLLISVISPRQIDSLHQHRLQRVAEALNDKVEPNNKLRNRIVTDMFQIIRQAPEWELADAFEILGLLKNDQQIAKKLLTLIQNNHLNNLGVRAARAIGKFDEISPDIAVSLLQIAEDSEQNKWLRFTVARVLEEMGQVEPKGQLLTKIAPNMIEEDSTYYRVAYTLKELGALDNAAKLSLNLVKREQANCIYRSYASKFFGKLAHINDTIISELLNFGLDEQVDVQFRVGVAESLTELGQVEIAEQIWLKLARESQHAPWARQEALKNLQALDRHKEVVQVWRDMAQDKEYPFRYKAAEELGKAGLVDEAKQFLLDNIQDNQEMSYGGRYKNTTQLLRSAQALGKIGQVEEAYEVFLNYSQDGRMFPGDQVRVAKILIELGKEESAHQLLLKHAQTYQSNSAHISGTIATTLGNLGQVKIARKILLHIIQDSEVFHKTRVDAAKQLGELGHIDEATQLLVGLASDRQIEDDSRYWAGKMLLQLNQTEQAKQVFLNLLQDQQFDKEKRSQVLESLSQFNQTDKTITQIIITEMLNLLSDNQLHEYFRCEAGHELGILGRGNKLVFTELFRVAHNDQEHNRVRCGAYQGLRNFLDLEAASISTCPHE